MSKSTAHASYRRVHDRVSGLSISDLPLVVTIGFLALFLLLVGSLVVGTSFFAFGDNTGITLDKIVNIYTDPETIGLLGNTLFIGLISGLIGTLLSAVYTWFVVRTNIPGRRYFRMLAISSSALPGIIMTFGWIAALAPGHGFINGLTQTLFGFDLFNIYSVWGIILAISLSVLNSGFLLLEAPFKSLSADLEEASRVAGYNRFETLRHITLPMMFPAMFSAFLLSAIYGIGNFEFVLYFTSYQGGLDTFATKIFSVIKLNIVPQYDTAAILSIPYMALAMVLITVYTYYTRKREKYVTIAGSGSREKLINLGKYRFLGLAYCLAAWGGAFLLPALGVVGMAFSPGLGRAFSDFTLENFEAFFELSGVQSVLINTFLFAFLGAVGTVVVSTLISYAGVKYDGLLGNIGDYASTIPLGFPPIVYGLAIFWMILLVPGLDLMYGTVLPLVIAMIFMKTPNAVRIISSNMIQISEELEEASRVSGRTWGESFRKITLPLSADGISNAFLWVFLDSLKELAGVVLLITAGSDVFTNYIMIMYSNEPSLLPSIAAGSLMFTAVILVIIAIQTRFQGYSSKGSLY